MRALTSSSVACRLVVEGGFNPETIKPRPPFRVESIGSGKRRGRLLHYDPSRGGVSEEIVLGGLKTKQVDVVSAIDGLGPCAAISVKGTRNAFRNFTNRMEEAVGDCTNLHLSYPALVAGFFVVICANRAGPVPASARRFIAPDQAGFVRAPDVALDPSGRPVAMIRRYHDALAALANRTGARETVTKYEAIALLLLSPQDGSVGQPVAEYPEADSVLRFDDFFDRIYRAYDERFVYFAPDLARRTRRWEWHPDSPALVDPRARDYLPRVQS